MEDIPLGNWKSFSKGILGGSLIGSGLLSLDFGTGIQAIVFLIGIIIIVDTIIPKTEEIYPLSMLLGILLGFFIALLFVILKASVYYTILILVLTVIFYILKIAKKLGRKI